MTSVACCVLNTAGEKVYVTLPPPGREAAPSPQLDPEDKVAADKDKRQLLQRCSIFVSGDFEHKCVLHRIKFECECLLSVPECVRVCPEGELCCGNWVSLSSIIIIGVNNS